MRGWGGQWTCARELKGIYSAEGFAQPMGSPLWRGPLWRVNGLFMLLGRWARRDVVVSRDVNVLTGRVGSGQQASGGGLDSIWVGIRCYF